MLFKQHLNTHEQQLRTLGLQIIIVQMQIIVLLLCRHTPSIGAVLASIV
jgi:hypothetical protein